MCLVPFNCELCYYGPMHTVRFVHAADLHLDAAFVGISAQAPQEIAAELHASTFASLTRLEALCLTEHPDFLVLAGDLYNAEDGSLAAQIAVRNFCVRLSEAGIPVFIVHGNHDPLSSRMKALVWPDGVTVFAGNADSAPVLRNGEIIAMVHGISHETDQEVRNLALLFHRARTAFVQGKECDLPEHIAQIGVLHCTLGDGPLRHAPCSVADLESAGLDFWALGHVHKRGIFGSSGRIAYSGSAQGLHINEQGPHGCHLVTLQGRNAVDVQFFSLGPVQWLELTVDVGEMETASNLLDVRDILLETLLTEARAAAHNPDLCIARLICAGRGNLDSLLRKPGALDEVLTDLRASGLLSRPRIWVKDILLNSRPMVDLEILRNQRDDLLGESLRCAGQLRADSSVLSAETTTLFADLFKNPLMRDVLGEFSQEELLSLLDAAELSCVDLLDAENPGAK